MSDRPSAIALVRKRQGEDGRYGDYLGEILAAEGFTPELVDLCVDGGAARLADFRDGVIVVAQALLSRAEARAIVDAARSGAGVIVVRPSLALQRELGLRSTNTTLRDSLLRACAGDTLTAFLGDDGLQVPTPSEVYQDEGAGAARIHATVVGGDAHEGHAALLSLPVGEGTVTVFSYDLAQAVAMLRHGDPAMTGLRSIGADDPYRPTDLLAHTVDPDRWHVPQADFHLALLDNAIALTAPSPAAAIRQWYFDQPHVSTVVVQDSDDDWSTSAQFDELIDSAERHGVPITFYLMGGTHQTVLSVERVHELAARGHSFGLHHNAFDASFDGEEQALVLDRVVADDLAWFRQTYGLDVLVNRNHCLVWKGYADLPRMFAEHGVLMELNAENSAAAWLRYMAGSGRPLRHVDENGTVIDVFQQATHVYDDSLVEDRLSGDVPGEVELFREFLLRHRDRYFLPTTLQSHPVSFASYSRAFFEGCWRVAAAEGVPLMSAEMWAQATLKHRQTSVVARPEPDGVTVTVTLAEGSSGATIAVPRPPGATYRADGSSSSAIGRDIYGLPHLLLRVEPDAAESQGETAPRRIRVRLVEESIDE